MSSTLRDFEKEVEPLTVREISPVLSPIGGEILGFIGPSNRDKNIIVCQNLRWPDENGKQHFYRKLGGYSFNEIDLEAIKKSGATRIVIEEIDNSRIFEFDLTQYLNGSDGGYVNGRQKLGVPISDARQSWSESEVTIIRDH